MTPEVAPECLRIASYNIRKALGTDRRRNPDRILRVIASLHADVVVLQEADMRMGARPSALNANTLRSMTGLHPVETPSAVSLGWHGNAVLVSERTVTTRVDHIDLPGIEPRGALVAHLEVAGRPLRVIASHLGLLRPSRKEQLSALFAHLEQCPPCPTLIAGDLNEWSNKAGLGRLAKRFTIVAPGKTYHARLPVASLDRMALDGKLEERQAGVVDNETTRRASDHLPIWVDIAHRE